LAFFKALQIVPLAIGSVPSLDRAEFALWFVGDVDAIAPKVSTPCGAAVGNIETYSRSMSVIGAKETRLFTCAHVAF
jgi:hypothetical protein